MSGDSEKYLGSGRKLPLLPKISEVLKITAEAFRILMKNRLLTIISNTFQKGAVVNHSGYINSTVNAIDKIVQLHEEKFSMYERMPIEKDDMLTRLERLIKQ